MRTLAPTGMLVLFAAVFGLAPNAASAAELDAQQVVQTQLDAYNAHNIDAFIATYAEDAQLFEHPSKLLASGTAQLRDRYTVRFRDPILHSEIAKRIVMGNTVIDHEKVRITFPEGTGTLEAVAIYEVKGQKIAKAWLIYGPKTLDPKQ